MEGYCAKPFYFSASAVNFTLIVWVVGHGSRVFGPLKSMGSIKLNFQNRTLPAFHVPFMISSIVKPAIAIRSTCLRQLARIVGHSYE